MTEKLTLRPLRGDDVFAVFELVDKLELIEPLTDLVKGNLRETFLEVAKSEGGEQDPDVAVGMEIVLKLSQIAVKNVPKARTEINDLLGDLTGTDAQTVANLPIKEYFRLVTDFFKHNDLQELLQPVLQSSKSESTK